MKSVRISIEWNYSVSFSVIEMKGNFKVYETAGTARIYMVTLFKNFHAWFYGNQTMKFLNVLLPQIFECYINSRIFCSVVWWRIFFKCLCDVNI